MLVPNIAVEASRQLAPLASDWPGNEWWHWVVFSIIIIAFVLVMIIGVIYIERRAIAWFAARTGPNRTGPFGLLQAIADAIKILLKEFITPMNADKIVFWIAPAVVFAPVIMVFAVVPFMNGAVLADLNIGILFMVAISSISTLGVFMAGWSSSACPGATWLSKACETWRVVVRPSRPFWFPSPPRGFGVPAWPSPTRYPRRSTGSTRGWLGPIPTRPTPVTTRCSGA